MIRISDHKNEIIAHGFSGLLNIILRCQDLPRCRPEITKAAFLYAECLHEEGNESEASVKLRRAVELFNEVYPDDPRSEATLTESDICRLFPYDYIWC